VRRGAWAWFCGVWNNNMKVFEFQCIDNLKKLEITLIFILIVAMAHGTLVYALN